MRIWRNPLYNRRGGFRRVPLLPMPRLRFRGRLPSPPVFCPEAGREIAFAFCLECPEFRVWSAQDGDFGRCRHEYLSLQARGYYDGTWDDHPENFDPETFERIQERKRLNEEFARDFDQEKVKMMELARALEGQFAYRSEYSRLDDESDEEESAPAQDDEDGDEY
jgi:hypothetical protein